MSRFQHQTLKYLWSLYTGQEFRKMKMTCPECGYAGFVQVRGSNVLIQHYKGYKDSKRSYEYHKIPYELYQKMQVNASKSLQVNTPKISSFGKVEWTGGDLNPRPPECKSGVHTN
jgi:hypothetical protein